MDYNYEGLDPERFQLFCQSLLNSEFPKFQSLPIGQPDGGRDGLVYLNRFYNRDEFIVFQVKFVRKDDKNLLLWLEDILKKEQNKINKLVKRGAKEYYLITNLSGTSHYDSGTIDQVDKLLKKYISIPAYCWWRDDLNTKLNTNWDIKWVFPELLSPSDLFRIIVESNLKTEDKERRFNAINQYVADQYEVDSHVKFKQIELQNKLFDLFIDVPISPKLNSNVDHKRSDLFQCVLSNHLKVKLVNGEYAVLQHHKRLFNEDEDFIGAATFFLDTQTQEYKRPVVLEGGPGQGKSTITQYICQIHRIRLLYKEEELRTIPDSQLHSPVRIPIKVDLRDFALWVNNKNPYSSGEEIIHTTNKSLDTFIALHINHFSSIEFNVNDLHEILKISKILLVLDGFDEVADISLREEIVSLINKGIKKFKLTCGDNIQVIITSRPATFLNSPSFSKEDYDYYYLESVNSILVDIYLNKWIKSKRLSDREGQEIKKILNEKLKQPHIKDLAKNPMQLAILISLIHTKGSSLPDKRTSFYDSYIEVFFNRESEKDATVRKYRDLIIELHQYIAWIIHRDAELGSNGRIEYETLIQLLEDYLRKEEHDISIARRLFNKMAERVVALVSRIEGVFEFEVQPLREYFCAKYLYITAPYSPAGSEKKGTKPDRFDAMSKNFYWLNVLRFYVGCFDKGELPTIIDRLQELTEDNDYKYISHPRELASILLSDWVFTQYPRLMKDVVRLLLDGLGLRTLLSTDMGYNYKSGISLPIDSGRNEIVNECFRLLEGFPPKDYSLELISVILSNDNGKISEIWESEILNKKGIDLINWLYYGLYLRILPKIDDRKLFVYFEDKQNLIEKTSIFIQAGKTSFIEAMPEVTEKMLEYILDAKVDSFSSINSTNLLPLYWRLLDTSLYHTIILYSSDSILCTQMINRRSFNEDLFQDGIKKIPKIPLTSNPKTNKYLIFLDVCLRELKKSAKFWNTSLDPWDVILAQGNNLFGERFAFYNIASLGATIKYNAITFTDEDSLFNNQISLMHRSRFARLKSKNATWWKKQCENIKNDNDRYYFLSLCIIWASTNVISKMVKEIEMIINTMNEENFDILYKSLKKMCAVNKQNFNYLNYEMAEVDNIKLIKILSVKLQGKNLIDFKNQYLINYEGEDKDILGLLIKIALREIVKEKDVARNLSLIKTGYQANIINDKNIFEVQLFRSHYDEFKMDATYAKLILSEPSSYPRYMVRSAEISMKNNIVKNIKSVKVISNEENWFA